MGTPTVTPDPLPDNPDDWQDPLATESAAAFSAYCAYRDLGPRRNQQKAAQAHYDLDELPARTTAKVSQVNKWSARYHWVARAREWDAHVDRETRADQMEQIKGMRERHAQIASVALGKVVQRLNSMSSDSISVAEMTRLIEVAVKVERQSRGEPDTITELAGPDHGPVLIDGLAEGVSNKELAERLERLDDLDRATVDG